MRASEWRKIVDGLEGSEPEICFVCGQKIARGAEWLGGSSALVWLCSACAERGPQPFAALLADAIADHGPPSTYSVRLTEALKRFGSEAWRALALALERQVNTLQRSAVSP